MEILIILKEKPVNNALFHIPTLHCSNCDEERDFYISFGSAWCVCCHEQVVPTFEQQLSVKKLLKENPRTPLLRFQLN